MTLKARSLEWLTLGGLILIFGATGCTSTTSRDDPTTEATPSLPSDLYIHVEEICTRIDWTIAEGLDSVSSSSASDDYSSSTTDDYYSNCRRDLGDNGIIQLRVELGQDVEDGQAHFDTMIASSQCGADVTELYPEWDAAYAYFESESLHGEKLQYAACFAGLSNNFAVAVGIQYPSRPIDMSEEDLLTILEELANSARSLSASS
ncbi:hypothetical protein [Stackebrandtia albiflava]|uniref:hypothetical protein n=1 Tax=Stackebrandtia albiflava TaxID=406432 RepID=UPI0011BF0425|nr:hypothetical protein [Stackebrandtia albiflava]